MTAKNIGQIKELGGHIEAIAGKKSHSGGGNIQNQEANPFFRG
jgi:hypothetical protein